MRSGIIIAVLLILVTGLAGAGKKAPFPGLEMTTYTAPDGSFSIYYPKGWTAAPSEMGISFAQDPADDTSAHIDVFVLEFKDAAYTSGQIIELLAKQMKQQYPSMKVVEQKQMSKEPDLRGVLFTYKEGGTQMSGFGLALSAGQAALWADIYGKDASFKNYNPVVVLSYVLQSMSQGMKPSKPQIRESQATAKAEANVPMSATETKKKIGEAAVMTHFWNNAQYIVPDAFSTYVPPLF
ncbi:MAG: hypothetical protein JRJ87_19355 [Deltaproteobacteria bacterium]|nr:hypothetical protein [Deltaproteobacteria bacterium]